jgi:hypothetical protein
MHGLVATSLELIGLFTHLTLLIGSVPIKRSVKRDMKLDVAYMQERIRDEFEAGKNTISGVIFSITQNLFFQIFSSTCTIICT